MDRVSLTIGAALLVTFLAGCKALVRATIEPDEEFGSTTAPPAPDYSDESFWSALPTRVDGADAVPPGHTDLQAAASVDVFFVHPTTYYASDAWNQPLDDEAVNERTDSRVMRNQASAFNAAGRVYAPRYRQATLAAFTTDRVESSEQALQLAYDDVKTAFDHYLSEWNDGRPIIVAAHSQGARHAMRLLADYFAEGKPLHGRLVAAYPVGMAIATDHFERTIPGIGACQSATDTGCIVAWNTLEEGAKTDRFYGTSFIHYPGGRESNEGKTLVCTNPVSWRNGGSKTDAATHRGAVRFGDDGEVTVREGYLAAECRDGLLYVEMTDREFSRTFRKDLHVLDYTLFYLDIRKNAVDRATAFAAP